MLPHANPPNDLFPMMFDEDDEPSEKMLIDAIADAVQTQERDSGTPVDKIEIAEELPVLPLRDTIIYPHIVAPLLVTEEPLIKLIDDALAGDRIVAVFAAREGVEDEMPGPDGLYDVGSAVAVARMFKLPDGKMQLLVQGVARLK